MLYITLLHDKYAALKVSLLLIKLIEKGQRIGKPSSSPSSSSSSYSSAFYTYWWPL